VYVIAVGILLTRELPLGLVYPTRVYCNSSTQLKLLVHPFGVVVDLGHFEEWPTYENSSRKKVKKKSNGVLPTTVTTLKLNFSGQESQGQMLRKTLVETHNRKQKTFTDEKICRPSSETKPVVHGPHVL
jgi:hypothetical protein